MSDAFWMKEIHACNDLTIELKSFPFRKSVLLHNIIKEFSPAGILHDKINIALGFNNFIEFNNIWMSNSFQNSDFSDHSFDICLVSNPVLLKDFHGNQLSTLSVFTKFDISKCSFTKFF